MRSNNQEVRVLKRFFCSLVAVLFVLSCFAHSGYAASTNEELGKYAQDKAGLNAKIKEAREKHKEDLRALRKQYSEKAKAIEPGDEAARASLCDSKKQDKQKIVESYRQQHESLMAQLRDLKSSARAARVKKAQEGKKEWNIPQAMK